MRKILTTTIAAACVLAAQAVPAMRGLRPVTQADGTVIMVERVGDERMNFTLDSEGALLRSVNGIYEYAELMADGTLAGSAVPVKWDSAEMQERISTLTQAQPAAAGSKLRAGALGLIPGRSFPSKGKQKAVVILVEYSDLSFTLDDPYTYFHDMLNKEGFSDPKYGGTGSCRDYFIEASLGQFEPDFDVYGPVKLSGARKDYGSQNGYGYEANAYKMVTEACEALDAEVDFSQYDRDNDGVIDNVFVFYAGQGEATYGPEESVWPHSSQVVGTHIHDGKYLDVYGCTNEWEANRPDGIGTFCHEFSHVLGLPDLYNTAAISSYTPGYWNVMDYGPYNNGGMTPPTYSTFERNALGWIELKELEAGMTGVEVPDLRTTNMGYCISHPTNAKEFYLLENRRREGSDKYLPGEGMLVWHVEYNETRFRNNIVNNQDSHQCVDLIEADNKPSKANGSENDPFPGGTGMSRLDTKWWNGTNTGVALRNITQREDGVVTFNTITPPEMSNSGIYTVDNAITSGSEDLEDVTVRGYIVGYVKNGNLSTRTATFSAGTSKTNILIADTPDETDWCNCIPVQLIVGTDARNELNLSENPEMIGKLVELSGTLTSYLGARGLKNVSDYKVLTSGIESIESAGAEEDTEWYTIQGIRVAAPDSPGIYIRKTSGVTSKVIVE